MFTLSFWCVFLLSLFISKPCCVSTSNFDLESLLKDIDGVEGEYGRDASSSSNHNALLQHILKNKKDDEIIEIGNSEGSPAKKMTVKDLRKYLDAQDSILGGLKRDADNKIYKEESGKLKIDEIEKGGDKNLQLFMMLGRAGHQMLLKQGHGFATLSNLVSSPRQENSLGAGDGEALKYSYPNFLIVTTKDGDGGDREASFELEFVIDSKLYDFPGFAIVNAWKVEGGGEMRRLHKIEGLPIPPPPKKFMGFTIMEIARAIDKGKYLGFTFIVFGVGSLIWGGLHEPEPEKSRRRKAE